ncbi:bacterioferritin [Colwellia sp. 4_MG-2023]|jgi:bacterioferritin|uniref:bacterioferritin n=1 Tax=unclassified Colwellia TaxID=196834 RepID=UPI001C09FF04|nr:MULTISPECIES: bacterioferritin [unclassified Colwellia]MBU2925449.1 bacterioferritin [Colwellia sp. C2M11]MDO6486529.1 bacterioferritin [Colwellia sp. 6_MG-2023]MDO6506407.1 bacterioferritin [Colwellia sp. 5_MG-2023]MDO6555231.1 bacterioferritin [Colwellia sp. 4_MG-2023]MDO6651583.1 bacterioferritin [Colwellia sp. 3_MG-2023]
MKGDKGIIALLNKALAVELIAINQYFLHARMYKNWGLEQLNKADYKTSIKKMKQADSLIERILFLEGLPNLQDLGRLHIGEETTEILQANIALEHKSRSVLQELIESCELQQDYISRDCAESLLESVETQIDWIEEQQYLITNVGLENYLQTMMN